VYARQYETRPRRMNYDILFRIQGNQALLIPLTTIKGRPVANDQPQERQHRAEIYLEDSDNHSLAAYCLIQRCSRAAGLCLIKMLPASHHSAPVAAAIVPIASPAAAGKIIPCANSRRHTFPGRECANRHAAIALPQPRPAGRRLLGLSRTGHKKVVP
jgi:hypothetical protein